MWCSLHLKNGWYLILQNTRLRYKIETCITYFCLTCQVAKFQSSKFPGLKTFIFTRGQFCPTGIVVACVCVYVCVRVFVTHELVRAIIYQPFKLGLPNLDQRYKRPWLRALLFCGTIDHDLQGQLKLQSQNLPNFELVRAITHHQLKLQFPNLEQKCILALFKSLPILGFELHFNF